MTTIKFLYRGSLLPDGTVFDDSGDKPHEIIVGRAQVMPVMEEALSEMTVGEEKSLFIAAQDAYGEYREEAVQRVPTFKIPNGANLPVGATILWSAPRSPRPIPAKVRSVVNQVAELDFNHPLAGKDLMYWLKVTARMDGDK
jgi:FKBP-type peptidyl-prolyl cis-trans isomerase 2